MNMLASINIVAKAEAAKVDSGVDLSGAWSGLWGSITNGWTNLAGAMTFIGVALVVFALVKWAWDRRRGGGMQGSGPMWGALIPGAIMMAPAILFPVILNILDFLINIVFSVIRSATKA